MKSNNDAVADIGFEDEEGAVLKVKEKEGVELGFEDDPNENPVEAAVDSNVGAAWDPNENGDGDEADDDEDLNEKSDIFSLSLSLSSVCLFLSLKIPLSLLCLFVSPKISCTIGVEFKPKNKKIVNLWKILV